MKNEKVWKIAMTGVFAALSYVVFTFLQFKIWLPGGDATSIHFGNAVCVLGALILGGVYGGIGGLLFNVIFDPLIGYFYKLVLLGKPAAEVTLSWNVAATSINAVLSTIASVVIYMALRPALQKSGLFSQVKAAAK